MDVDLLDLYRRASEWTGSKVPAAAGKLDSFTGCDDWDVRTLLNHTLETQNYFADSATGQDATPPSPQPPDLIGDDPVASFDAVRDRMLQTFGEPGVIEKTGSSLGVAFSDMLLHGWDLATATGQDTTMPDGLADSAYQLIHGKFTDEQRKGIFKPEVPLGPDASPQARLLGYTGRDPDR